MAEAPYKLLIVDGDQDYRQALAEALSRRYHVSQAGSLKEARQLIVSQAFDLAITELRLPDASGLTLLAGLRKQRPNGRVLVLTAKGSIPSAVEAMRQGAIDYLLKPSSPALIESCLLGRRLASPADPYSPYSENASDDRPLTLDENEQNYIEFAMIQCDHNITQAARWLGIHRQSLQRMLKRVVGPV